MDKNSLKNITDTVHKYNELKDSIEKQWYTKYQRKRLCFENFEIYDNKITIHYTRGNGSFADMESEEFDITDFFTHMPDEPDNITQI